jgi:uncharacterized protein YfbU (UPF0304 family)
MKLDKKERLQFIYQLKILDKLYPEEEYRHHIKALEEGYELHYSWIFDNLSEELSSDECRNVLDILGVYRTMIHSYESLVDSNQINEMDQIDEKLLRFPGFDGNNETKFMMYVNYFLNDLDRFQEIKDRSNKGHMNSHKELLKDYNTLLDTYKGLTKETDGLLSKQDLITLLKLAPKGYL